MPMTTSPDFLQQVPLPEALPSSNLPVNFSPLVMQIVPWPCLASPLVSPSYLSQNQGFTRSRLAKGRVIQIFLAFGFSTFLIWIYCVCFLQHPGVSLGVSFSSSFLECSSSSIIPWRVFRVSIEMSFYSWCLEPIVELGDLFDNDSGLAFCLILWMLLEALGFSLSKELLKVQSSRGEAPLGSEERVLTVFSFPSSMTTVLWLLLLGSCALYSALTDNRISALYWVVIVMVHLCEVCSDEAFFKCPLCEKTYYCSDKHQRQNWSTHRLSCSENPIPEFEMPEAADLRESGFSFFQTTTILPEIILPAERMVKNKARTKEIISKGAALKRQMEVREMERTNTLSHYFNGNFQTALISCRRVTVTSQRITNEINPLLIEEIDQTFCIKTTKLLQEMQYLLDNLLLIKIFASLEKHQEMKDTIFRLRMPPINPRPPYPQMQSKSQIAIFNTWKQEVCRYECILRSFILITSKKEMYVTTESLFIKYLQLVSTAYGEGLEYATACFTFAQWYAQSPKMEKHLQNAKKYNEICLSIREKHGDSLPLADVLYNLAIIVYNDKKQASGINLPINLLQRSLQIRKNIFNLPNKKFIPSMELLGRFYMLNGQFLQAYEILHSCFKIESMLLTTVQQHNDKVRTQVLLVFLYKNILQYVQNQPNHPEAEVYMQVASNLKENVLDKYEQFSAYLIDDNDIVESHFQLNISEELFETLSANQIEQLSVLLKMLEEQSFAQGVETFRQSNLFKTSDNNKKTMFIVSNPALDEKRSLTPTSNARKGEVHRRFQ